MPQCKPSRGRKRGICWCVDKYGVQLPGTDYSGGDIQCKDLESSNNNEWKSGRDHLRQPRPPPSPAPNHHVTQGPRLLSESHLYAPPSVHFKKFGLFFFLKSKKKKEEEKRKSKTKEQAEQKTPVFYFFLFFILFFCRRPSTHLRMRGEKKSQKISPSVPWLLPSWTSPPPPRTRQVRWLQVPWKYMHPMDIFFIEAGGFNTKHFVWCKKKKKINTKSLWRRRKKMLSSFRPWEREAAAESWRLADELIWFFFLSVFQKKKKKKKQ